LQEALPQGSPAWATWNVSGSWQMNDALEIRVAAMNVLDLHYRTFGSGLSAPGRNLRLTATAQF
jgi:hemoglobin/transferrin/lactoferrin receptor protein